MYDLSHAMHMCILLCSGYQGTIATCQFDPQEFIVNIGSHKSTTIFVQFYTCTTIGNKEQLLIKNIQNQLFKILLYYSVIS